MSYQVKYEGTLKVSKTIEEQIIGLLEDVTAEIDRQSEDKYAVLNIHGYDRYSDGIWHKIISQCREATVDFEGEDYAKWRLCLEGGKVVEKQGEIIYEGDVISLYEMLKKENKITPMYIMECLECSDSAISEKLLFPETEDLFNESDAIYDMWLKDESGTGISTLTDWYVYLANELGLKKIRKLSARELLSECYRRYL